MEDNLRISVFLDASDMKRGAFYEDNQLYKCGFNNMAGILEVSICSDHAKLGVRE